MDREERRYWKGRTTGKAGMLSPAVEIKLEGLDGLQVFRR